MPVCGSVSERGHLFIVAFDYQGVVILQEEGNQICMAGNASVYKRSLSPNIWTFWLRIVLQKSFGHGDVATGRGPWERGTPGHVLGVNVSAVLQESFDADNWAYACCKGEGCSAVDVCKIDLLKAFSIRVHRRGSSFFSAAIERAVLPLFFKLILTSLVIQGPWKCGLRGW